MVSRMVGSVSALSKMLGNKFFVSVCVCKNEICGQASDFLEFLEIDGCVVSQAPQRRSFFFRVYWCRLDGLYDSISLA